MAEKVVNIYLGASSLRTCLGNKAETLDAMLEGNSGLAYDAVSGMYAGRSLVKAVAGYTRFESMLIEQIEGLLAQTSVDLKDKDACLLVSTTKGNVALLSEGCENIPARAYIYDAVSAVAGYFGCVNRPVVISNACVSGVSAFVVAKELLHSGLYRHVVVAAADALCDFITSGFASFKSIGSVPCRPYDAERDGLTLGEAAAAVLLTTEREFADKALIRLAGGAVTNDANHISGPSRTGDGLYYAIKGAMSEAGIGQDDVGFVNTHGTATRYNDEMESKAVAWAGLDNTPLNSLKGYIGHTLGASGVVETIICAEELKLGYIYGTKGFVSSDTPHRLALSGGIQAIEKRCCVKTASGFGGCNAAIVLDVGNREAGETVARDTDIAAEYVLPQSGLPFAEFVRNEFRAIGESNMKFYKMSDLAKALYISVERLLATGGLADSEPVRRAIVLANSAASLDADIVHQRIVDQHLPEGASPSAFVYTLPNVAAGEMCIRHKIQGDNTFFIEDKDSGMAGWYAGRLIETGKADAVIFGWCEYIKGEWNVNLKLLKNK